MGERFLGQGVTQPVGGCTERPAVAGNAHFALTDIQAGQQADVPGTGRHYMNLETRPKLSILDLPIVNRRRFFYKIKNEFIRSFSIPYLMHSITFITFFNSMSFSDKYAIGTKTEGLPVDSALWLKSYSALYK